MTTLRTEEEAKQAGRDIVELLRNHEQEKPRPYKGGLIIDKGPQELERIWDNLAAYELTLNVILETASPEHRARIREGLKKLYHPPILSSRIYNKILTFETVARDQ